MAFPTEFPNPAVAQLLSIAEDQDPGRISLAVYDLVGYGLGFAFPDAKYPTGFSPEKLKQVKDVLAYLKNVDWQKWVAVAPEIVAFVVEMKQQGYPTWRIAIATAIHFRSVFK